jgi:starch synthase (maltosyl-transferring)
LKLHVPVYRSPFAESRRTVPSPLLKQPPPASRSRTCARRSTADAIPSRRTRRPRRRLGDDLQGRPRRAPRRRPLPAARDAQWLEQPLEPLGNDRWAGELRVDELGRWQFTIEAWVDRYATLLDELDRKLAAGQTELAGELVEARRSSAGRRSRTWRARRRSSGEGPARQGVARRPLEVDVDRERARFGAWYELFPRSWGGFRACEGRCRSSPSSASTSSTCRRPPDRATNRKGRNNALDAAQGDPGSPWAIGGAEGGTTHSIRARDD